MITKNYKENKNDVLQVYKDFVDFNSQFNYSIDQSIENQATKIENEIFNLMVIGEAKSGKSTFINAYLGKEVLPMDVRQCTSSIIEIKRGVDFSLVAETAGGGIIKKNTESDISEFLKNHAAIQDEYRKIPVTTINNELILPSKGKFTEADIESFLASSTVKDNNIYDLPVDDYESIIRKYLTAIQPHWEDIITKISIEYPLPESMQGIRIIDSPGVGAGGNVGKIAEDYINNANAIIFVKALTGQALESSSFRDFFNTNCRKKNKSSVFLVFSRIADLSGMDLARQKSQAIEMYEKSVQKDKILFVDSKTQLIKNICENLRTEGSIDNYINELDNRQDGYDPVTKRWYKARGDVSSFFESLDELSNFDSISQSLEKFARKAGYVQLESLVSAIYRDYEGKLKSIEKLIKQLNDNLDSTPEELTEKIKQKKQEIEAIYTKIEKNLGDVRNKYADILSDDSIIKTESKKKGEEYKKKLEIYKDLTEAEIENKGFDKVANELKTETLDSIDDTKDFQKKIGLELIHECDEMLIEIGKEKDDVPIEAYKPNFTAADFDDIDKKAENETSGDEYHAGGCFEKSWTEHYHHKQAHISMICMSIKSKLETSIIPGMEQNAVQYVDNLLSKYKEKLASKGLDLKNQCDELIHKLEEVRNIQKLLEENQEQRKKILSITENVRAIHMEIMNYVN